MASLYQRGSNWYIQFYSNRKNPSQKQHSLRTSDKREAQRRKLDLEDAREAGTWDPWKDDVEVVLGSSEQPLGKEELTCGEAFEAFLEVKKREGCTQNTLRSYRGNIRRLLDQCDSDLPLRSLRRAHIERYVRAKGIAQATQRKRYRHVKAWLNWLTREEHLDGSPMRKMKAPKAGRKLPKALRRHELEALCDIAPQWFGQMLRFAVYTGLRSSELGRLQWQHVDFDRDLIRIYEQKNGHEQTIPLVDKARAVLEEADHSEGPIFNVDKRPIRRWVEYVSLKFRRLRERADLRDEISMHSTRHSTATFLAESGISPMSIKEFMRHANISTSLTYIHMANERLKEEVNTVF